jgi:hypothetical protein
MDTERFDALVKRLETTRLTRGGAVRGLMAGALAAVAGAALSADETDAKRRRRRRRRSKVSAAAPQTCVTCQCGVGRPCNVKEETCTVLGQQFPSPEDACTDVCTRHGFKFCGAGTQYHCPRGCQ